MISHSRVDRQSLMGDVPKPKTTKFFLKFAYYKFFNKLNDLRALGKKYYLQLKFRFKIRKISK